MAESGWLNYPGNGNARGIGTDRLPGRAGVRVRDGKPVRRSGEPAAFACKDRAPAVGRFEWPVDGDRPAMAVDHLTRGYTTRIIPCTVLMSLAITIGLFDPKGNDYGKTQAP